MSRVCLEHGVEQSIESHLWRCMCWSLWWITIILEWRKGIITALSSDRFHCRVYFFLIESLSNQTHVRQTLRPCAVVRLVSFLTQVSMRVCDVMMLVNELQQVVSGGQWLSSGMHRGPDGGAPYVQLSKLKKRGLGGNLLNFKQCIDCEDLLKLFIS